MGSTLLVSVVIKHRQHSEITVPAPMVQISMAWGHLVRLNGKKHTQQKTMPTAISERTARITAITGFRWSFPRNRYAK